MVLFCWQIVGGFRKFFQIKKIKEISKLKMYKSLILIASCLLGFSAACKVSSTSFTTTDATVLSQIAFLSEFSISNCKNDINHFPLFAEVDGRLSPVVRIGDKYQVNFILQLLLEFFKMEIFKYFRSVGVRM